MSMVYPEPCFKNYKFRRISATCGWDGPVYKTFNPRVIRKPPGRPAAALEATSSALPRASNSWSKCQASCQGLLRMACRSRRTSFFFPGCGSKMGIRFGSPANGNMDENLRSPGSILTHTPGPLKLLLLEVRTHKILEELKASCV